MREYSFEVKVNWGQTGIEANALEEAKEKLKEIFTEEFNFTPTNEGIKEIK